MIRADICVTTKIRTAVMAGDAPAVGQEAVEGGAADTAAKATRSVRKCTNF